MYLKDYADLESKIKSVRPLWNLFFSLQFCPFSCRLSANLMLAAHKDYFVIHLECTGEISILFP